MGAFVLTSAATLIWGAVGLMVALEWECEEGDTMTVLQIVAVAALALLFGGGTLSLIYRSWRRSP